MVRKDHARRRLQERARQVPRGRRARSRSCHKRGQPVLVGTVSRREVRGASPACSSKKGIPHNVLNAKQHEREADDRRAGRPQGRGHHLDQHGRPRHRHPPRRQRRVHGARRGRSGHEASRPMPRRRRRVRRPSTRRRSRKFKAQCDAEKQEVLAAGGLHILGTERHESRRIDNQLRGRAGRQGDPGSLALLPVARRRPDAHLRRRAHHRPDGAPRHGRGRAHRARRGQRADRERAEARSRATTSTSARTCSSTTTS